VTDFRIADTFTDSLARLTGDEQKAAKTTAFDLQLNPVSPGMSLHKLEKAKDRNFWSVRVNADIRIIVHRTPGSFLLCYVGHHDKAYDWAERRKLEAHPKTGAAQLIEIRETVREVNVPVYVHAQVAANPRAPLPLFGEVSDDQLLSYGVPAEWLDDVRKATEDSLFTLTDHLPAEASEALLELATGGQPRIAQPLVNASSFDHPDAQRRFRTMKNVEELEQALEYPWEKWTIFLHPEQRQLVERDYSGPAKVSGSAGTGKTIVAVHRAVQLARANPGGRVLLTTFSDALAHALQTKLRRLLGNEPRLGERIDVLSLRAIGMRLYSLHVGKAAIASQQVVRELLREATTHVPNHSFSAHFLLTEWEQIVDAWQLDGWEAYRDVVRLGRKTRLAEPQRTLLWSIFDRVRAGLKTRNLITESELFTALGATIVKNKRLLFDYVVIDEAQDLSVAQLRFLAALGAKRPNALFFAGDLGQRIFQQPFSWKALGVDTRGRSRTLRVNYRTSHQIRVHADRLLDSAVVDADGNVDERNDTVSVFNGPQPTIGTYKNQRDEIAAVGVWMAEHTKAGILPHEFGVFVRSNGQLDRARAAVAEAGLSAKVLDEHLETISGHVSVSTMHLAKGLEFRAVAVMACDDEVVPLQERIEAVGDDADLREVYDTERQLLYVACTRARDDLLVTSVEPASEFLDDLKSPPTKTV
jgi:superfamily I DNA/RNA helicase/mRNA-degrading endonuclease RelE of RelBE toxin-antitoxin system